MTSEEMAQLLVEAFFDCGGSVADEYTHVVSVEGPTIVVRGVAGVFRITVEEGTP